MHTITNRYSSEKDHADRNFALFYFLKENKVIDNVVHIFFVHIMFLQCFPPNVQMSSILDYYFQVCTHSLICVNYLGYN